MKKTLIFSLAFAGLLSVSLFSCKKDNNIANKDTADLSKAQVTNANGRLVFKDSQALNQTINELMNKDPESLVKWEKSLNFNSLRSDSTAASSFESFGFPDFYTSIINNKGEYMIGDTIVYFNNGYKHLIANKDEALLAKIKSNPSLSTLKFKAGNQVIYKSAVEGSLSTQSVGLANGQIDARYQYQFLRNGDNNSKRKLVFEIQNYVEGNPFAYICYVHTRIKQEYLGGNKPNNWLPAGEPTEKKITGLSFDVSFINTGNGTTTHVTGANINASQTDGNNLDRVLCTFQASQSTITASVRGTYYARVLPPYNSDGKSTYTVNAVW
ncbi:hypothetical protein SNE25_13815 [Mucilaginibacter sabulilitoris]|uniref:Lipoprotein n=1 Tax=Mucilaginibacter sabulilitoris TaxID=1173583 RepID=A0ABZ0TZQ6_9SPHI|nr:hypothetical protein [Mucilaginibacter sabulilitoris]WPU96595.1 hypothetical protein SNE25_13815 [Mucilaginibacter sabulilitoris]